jgi:hypothetical protein
MAARRRDRDGVDGYRGGPEGDYPGQHGPAPDPAWAGHPSFPFPAGDYPAQTRAVGRSGGPRPVPPTADPSYCGVAFGDGQFQAALTEDLTGVRAGTRGLRARTGQMPQFAGAGTAEVVDDPIQREAEALWAADSGRLAQRILSNADRQAVQIRQDASAQAAETIAAAEREAAELRAAVMRMAAELGTVAAYVTESLGSHAKPPTRADAPFGGYVAENLAISAMPAPWPDDLVTEASPATQPEAWPPTVPAARPAARPAGRPGARPATKPAARPAGRPTARPAGKPAVRPATKPAARPAGRPAAQPTTKPAGRPAGRPGARSARRPAAGRGRQVAAMRFAAIGTSVLFLVTVVAGAAEIYLHGFDFFTFRSTGTGETGPNGLNENQGPGQPDAPRPTPSHIKVQPSPHAAVAVHNGQ